MVGVLLCLIDHALIDSSSRLSVFLPVTQATGQSTSDCTYFSVLQEACTFAKTLTRTMPPLQGCCAHDHDCEEADCGPSWSLHEHIDLPRVSVHEISLLPCTAAHLLVFIL